MTPSLFLTFPLTDPVLIFSLILFFILIVPMALHRLKIPDLIGLIIAGAIVGPKGLGILERDSSIEIFGKVGLLYIMFVAGLEIDLGDLKKNYGKSLYFGIMTFVMPMLFGFFASFYILHFSVATSLLLASIFASHTLITYPIVSKYNVTKNRAVNISVGATVITCLLSLFILAGVVAESSGKDDSFFWWKLGLSTIIFATIIIFVIPKVARAFFKRHEDSVSQYIFILAMVFLSSFLAKVAGLEDIIGAFLAGLALNRLVPNTSALMNRIEFIGKALFIPYFLIGVGMLLDYRVFIQGSEALFVTLIMCVVAISSKYVAAMLTGWSLRYSESETRLLFGLTNSQAAATLAAVIVGFNVHLLNESVLNGTIVMILVTCTIAAFVTQRGASGVAIDEIASDEPTSSEDIGERILIPLSNPDSVEELMNIAVSLKASTSKSSLVAINIITSDNDDPLAEKKGQFLLEEATKAAAATDTPLLSSIRYASNITSGITNVVMEDKITHIILGLHQGTGLSKTFLGQMTEGVLDRCNATTLVYRPAQPMSTLKRYIVFIPPHAEDEVGFSYWLVNLWNLARNTGAKLRIYCSLSVMSILHEVQNKHSLDVRMTNFIDWTDFEYFTGRIRPDDAIVAIMSRKGYPSYSKDMMLIPDYMDTHFNKHNCLLIYPMQSSVGFRNKSFYEHALLGSEQRDVFKELFRLFKK